MEPLLSDDPATIGGYRLLARLGEGGMGRVYLARSITKYVVVKTIRPEIANDPRFRARFRREADLARQVAGLYTAAVIDADPEAEWPWLAAEYVPGPSLQQAVRSVGPLPMASLPMLTAGLAEALIAVHQAGMVHRDLKPENVLLAVDGPRVIDFGVAKPTRDVLHDNTPLTRGLIGTIPYMSPEQLRDQPLGSQSDVFALGGVLYFAATGRHPFGRNDPALPVRIIEAEPVLDLLPEEMRELVGGCLVKDPGDRWELERVRNCFGEIDLGPAPWLPEDVLVMAATARARADKFARLSPEAPGRAPFPQPRTETPGSPEQPRTAPLPPPTVPPWGTEPLWDPAPQRENPLADIEPEEVRERRLRAELQRERDRARYLSVLRQWERLHGQGQEPPPYGWDPNQTPAGPVTWLQQRLQLRLEQRREPSAAWMLTGAIAWVVFMVTAFWVLF